MQKKIWVNGSPVSSVSVGGELIEADIVILASGVRANFDMAKNAGIELGKWGIKTNAGMETNIKGVYAIGDCVETVSQINHRPTMMQLSSSAYRQGMVAGANAAGARINVISMAIRCGMDVYSLSRTEMAYCPGVAENYNVLNKAADFAIRKLEKGGLK